ncbi:MAG: GAF domain-containing protein [Gemmatimonadaceae bacterium]|jgi:GAF domain-containing protein|nr:GAF domain-containing protein [Gemmatimonadaceae bacterium]
MPTPDRHLFPTIAEAATAIATPSESPAAERPALTPALLLDRLSRATTAQQRLRDAIAATARAVDEDELLRELVRQAHRLVPADGVSLALFDAEHGLSMPPEYQRSAAGARTPPALIERGAREASRTGQTVREVLTLVDEDDRTASCGVIAVPLRLGTHALGALVAWTVGDALPDIEDEDRLSTLGAAAAPALAHLRREAQGERERREIEALVDVARAAAASLRFGDTMRLILRHACALTHAEGALIALREGSYLHVRAVHGSVALLAGVHVPLDGSLMGDALRQQQPVVINDMQQETRAHPTIRDFRIVERAVIAPLTTDAGPVGTLVVVNRGQPFTDADARVLHRLANLVAVAIVNAKLFEAVEQATREWRAAVDAIASGVFVLDDEHRIIRCNLRGLELARVSVPLQALGRRFESLVLGVDDERWQEPTVAAAMRDATPLRGTTIAGRAGHPLAIAVSPHPNGGAVVVVDTPAT